MRLSELDLSFELIFKRTRPCRCLARATNASSKDTKTDEHRTRALKARYGLSEM